jgi:hypothetical protein
LVFSVAKARRPLRHASKHRTRQFGNHVCAVLGTGLQNCCATSFFWNRTLELARVSSEIDVMISIEFDYRSYLEID